MSLRGVWQRIASFGAAILISATTFAAATPEGTQVVNSTFDMIQDTVFSISCMSASCHSDATKAGGLSLAKDKAYDSLIGADAFNEKGAGLGWKRVVPGQPMKSFLMSKLLSPAPGMGELMPLGTKGLLPAQIKAVREWIAAGAPRDGIVKAAPNLYNLSLPKQAEIEPLEPPTRGVQLHLEPFEIQPGSEREVFFAMPQELKETIYVNEINIRMKEGSHHFILYRIAKGEPPLSVFRDLNPHDPQEFKMVDREYLIGSQTSSYHVKFPEGVALRLEKGSRFDMNSHYLNLSGGTLYADEFCAPDAYTGEVYVNLHTIPESDVKRLLHPIFNSNEKIDVPHGETRATTKTWKPGANARVLMLTSHMHRHGIKFEAERLGGQPLYETQKWYDPDTVWFDPPLNVAPGDGIRHTATHRNHDRPETLRFGYTSQDEMAILLGYYFIEE
ncbi:MAG: hypothetical protein O3A46_12410 [Candidatus Poribacteria bacterium]|nr:hypothetical protein [Candidatus Poribacteria bacterium]